MVATVDVVDAHGATITLNAPLPPGRIAAASSRPVALSTEDAAALAAVATTANQTSQITQETAINTILGLTSGAAVITDAAGTLQQYLRGLVKLIAAGINTTITNANVNIVALAGGTVAAGTAGAPVVAADQYSTHKEVGAGATATVLGATGAIGDYLDSVTVYPGVVACGLVTILDGSTAIGTFAGGGTTALPSCIPFVIPVGAFCSGAGWKITTGASVTVSCKGKFT